jgi:hypothetical protein
MNQGLVDLGKAYQAQTPAVLAPGINAARDFLINVIAPKLLALDNGLQDGVEVLRLAMEEEPQAGKYFHTLHSMLDQALKIKMASFIAQQCELTAEERTLFLELTLRRDSDKKAQSNIADLIKELGGDAKTPMGNNQDVRPGPNARQLKRQQMAQLNRETNSINERNSKEKG